MTEIKFNVTEDGKSTSYTRSLDDVRDFFLTKRCINSQFQGEELGFSPGLYTITGASSDSGTPYISTFKFYGSKRILLEKGRLLTARNRSRGFKSRKRYMGNELILSSLSQVNLIRQDND